MLIPWHNQKRYHIHAATENDSQLVFEIGFVRALTDRHTVFALCSSQVMQPLVGTENPAPHH